MIQKWHQHLGVYGICLNEIQELLVVLKNGGPYTGRYDLPGGSLENRESLVDCLIREMKEETGAIIEILDNLGSYDFLVKAPYDGCEFTHHIALLYKVRIKGFFNGPYEHYVFNKEKLIVNDASRIEWVDINMINSENSSPLVIKVLEIIKNGSGDNNMSEYLN